MTEAQPYPAVAAIGEGIRMLAAGHIDRYFRHGLRGPNVTAERRFVRLVTGTPHPFGNFAVVSDPADVDGVRAAAEPLLTCGGPAAVLLPGPVSEAVAGALAARGFAATEGMPVMVADIDALPATRLPDGYVFEQVARGTAGDEWAAAFSVGYEVPDAVGEAASPNGLPADDASVRFYAIRKAGRMVATSSTYHAEGVAGVYCVSTAPAERSRGLGAHVTAEALRRSRTAGYRVGVLQSSQAGYSVYRQLGFGDVGLVGLYVRMPG